MEIKRAVFSTHKKNPETLWRNSGIGLAGPSVEYQLVRFVQIGKLLAVHPEKSGV